MQEEGDPAYSYRTTSGGLKVIRGRGCEESFRAAVVDKHLVDPNHRSEISKPEQKFAQKMKTIHTTMQYRSIYSRDNPEMC